MIEFYTQDYIKLVTVEYTDNRVRVVKDSYVLNQFGYLLTTMSQENELELNKLLDEEGKTMNSELKNDAVDLEESFLLSHKEYENDDILLNSRVNNDCINTKKNMRVEDMIKEPAKEIDFIKLINLLENNPLYEEKGIYEKTVLFAAILFELGIKCYMTFGRYTVTKDRYPDFDTIFQHYYDREVCWLTIDNMVLDIGNEVLHFDKKIILQANIQSEYINLGKSTLLEKKIKSIKYKPLLNSQSKRSVRRKYWFRKNTTMYNDIKIADNVKSTAKDIAAQYLKN